MRSRLRCSIIRYSRKRIACARPVTCKTNAHLTPVRRRPTSVAPADENPSLSARVRALLVSTLSSIAVVLSSSLPVCAAEKLTIKFPASRDPEIRAAQETLVQAWGYVRELYVDPTFNKQDWKQRLEEALAATFKAASRDEALKQVSAMLDTLGDPFTRVLLPGGASEAFQAITKAKIVSTGLLVGRVGSAQGPLQVSFVVDGSPAAEAGLRVGDEVVAVNGRPVWLLRGDPTSLEDLLRQDVEVRLKLLRPLDAVQRSAAAGTGGGGVRAAAAAARRTAAAASATAAQEPPPLPTFASPVLDLDSVPDVAAVGDAGAAAEGEGSRALLGEAAQYIADSSGVVSPATAGATTTDAAAASTSGGILRLQTAPSTTVSTSYPLPGNFFDVVLRPAPVEFVPVQYAVLEKEANKTGALRRSEGGVGSGGDSLTVSKSSAQSAALAVSPQPSRARVGYIRIVAFTEHVGEQVESAIKALQAEGCGSWLLDVRSNPGGIVGEGLRVAELLIPPGEVFARVRDRSGEEQAERLSDTARPLVEGQPLAVLVDHFSASTSELLAGALHDDAHALLLGERTYGKGRTQTVVQLNGGATLLVSTDTYVTPGRRVVDRVGLPPDVVCRPGPPPPPVPRPVRATPAGDLSGAGAGGGGSIGLDREQIEMLARDACVRAAIGKLTRGSQQQAFARGLGIPEGNESVWPQ